jgi:hypothetical protein
MPIITPVSAKANNLIPCLFLNSRSPVPLKQISATKFRGPNITNTVNIINFECEMISADQIKKVSTKTIIRLINEIFLKCHLGIILEYRLIRRMLAKPDTMYPRAIIFSSKVESNRECAAISNAPIKIPRKTDCARSIDTIDSSPGSVPRRVYNLSLIIAPLHIIAY